MIAATGKARLGLLGLALLASVVLACGTRSPTEASHNRAPAPDQSHVTFAAPGRVEGASDLVEVGTALDGILAEVTVKEGDHVQAGQVLARLACDDLEAHRQSAIALADEARQSRRRLVRGARDEQRRAAEAATAAAQAELVRARARFDRLSHVQQEASAISADDLDAARRDLGVADAALHAATENEALTKASPLPEELAKADAQVTAAEQDLRETEAKLAKCSIRCPIDGVVLRRHLQPGEQVSLAYPRPIFSLADTSRFRVRAEVDERDIGRVHDGQQAVILVDARPDLRLSARVARIEPVMGRKRVRTGDPAEKSDRDIQEILLDLEDHEPALPVGLRVTVQFLD